MLGHIITAERPKFAGVVIFSIQSGTSGDHLFGLPTTELLGFCERSRVQYTQGCSSNDASLPCNGTMIAAAECRNKSEKH